MHIIYQLVSYLVIGMLLPLWMLHPKLRQGLLRRLGFYGAVTAPGEIWPKTRGTGPRILLHGASAGDLLALLPIILELRQRAPEVTLIVSTMTNSGYAIAKDRLQALVDGVTLVPYDLPGATHRAMAVLAPDLLVLEYTELWPNLIHAAKARGTKVALTNGRLCEGNMRRYRWMGYVFGNTLLQLDLLLMREEVEAERALTLGAPPSRICVTGNTKFDNLVKNPPGDSDGLAVALGHQGETWFVAGSTHEGEERAIIEAFKGMREVRADLRLLIAPRYTERCPKVVALAKQAGLEAGLRSTVAARTAEVVVMDSMGELALAYSLATLVFVGGSFVQRGGQNILEPAGQGRAVLFGPNMRNFRDSVEVLLGRGGIQVANPEQLEKMGRELLARPEEIEHLGSMARAAVQKVRGASARNAEALLKLL